MAEKQKENEAEPLSPEQRIELLEKKVGSNKLVLLMLALLIIVAISVSVTVVVFNVATSDDEDVASHEVVVAAQQEIAQLKEQMLLMDSRMAKLKADLEQQEAKLMNSGNRVLQVSMIEQEQNYQIFLSTLRSAVYDLAHMVRGSRSWLELYSEQIDQAAASSAQREQRLKNISSSSEEAESFFSDF